MDFKLESNYKPAGDQPTAIKDLVQGVRDGEDHQVLLGVTGSGKTFTVANVIQELKRPTLILSHNKTLVAQLYGEFKQFFPENAVEYFVSYYDYYQPEAYVSSTDTYIEKDLSINDEIEKLRLSTTSSLLSGRRDIVVVASVSCIFGMGSPSEYKNGIIRLTVGDQIGRNAFLHSLVSSLYSRSTASFERGNFRVSGDTVDINLPYADFNYRVIFFGDEIESLQQVDQVTGARIEEMQNIAVFPANLYLTPKDMMGQVISEIQDELHEQENYFKDEGRFIEATRLKEKTNFDLEMIKELGYCSGIENYSRFLDRRQPGERPFCLIDYFPEDYLLVVDESHVTIPQVGGMSGGDRSRKMALVENGFRLPSALDNRPLSFEEFQGLTNQVIYVSATPGNFELEKTDGEIVEQVVRPTGLLDPPIDVRPSKGQIDDLLDEIQNRIEMGDRILVTTLTKRMAEELTQYLSDLNIRTRYIHSEVDTLDRVEIIRDLRLGKFDVLVGVNLLREGLDLPEVSLVAILDADKEGFLRNTRSLIQVSGRAARNANGLVIMYADKITDSMQAAMDESNRRREKQIKYNTEHNITPQTVKKSKADIIKSTSVLDIRKSEGKVYDDGEEVAASIAADPIVQNMSKEGLRKSIDDTRKKMQKAAKQTEFMDAARLRDEMYALIEIFEERFDESYKL